MLDNFLLVLQCTALQWAPLVAALLVLEMGEAARPAAANLHRARTTLYAAPLTTLRCCPEFDKKVEQWCSKPQSGYIQRLPKLTSQVILYPKFG